jgi:hypothetical protein
VTAPSCFAFDPSGPVLVIHDGKEVLVHGKDEAPLWRKELAGEILGLAATGDAVVTLEAGGKISWWSKASGAPLGTVTTGAAAFALVSARSAAVCLAVLPGGVEVAELGKEIRSIPFLGPVTAAALRDDGAQIAVGSEDGEVAIVAGDGAPVGKSKLDGAVRSLCWSPAGFWIATAGERIVRVEPGGGPPRPITRAGGFKPDCLATSSDGALFAMRLDENLCMAYGYPPGVQLRYLGREITGLAFGPPRRLGVGLRGGDGNVADIGDGQLYRTDTFPGRTHNSWLVEIGIHPSAAPPAGAAPAPVAAPAPPAGAPQTDAGPGSTPLAQGPSENRKLILWGLALVAIVILASIVLGR